MKKYEYKTIYFEAKGLLGGTFNLDALNEDLNTQGSKGWNLVEAFPSNQEGGKTKFLICIFKREL